MTAGQNYGWDWLEASHCYPPEVEDCSRGQVGILPVAEYQHGEDGCAVIGIGVYRGDAYAALDGIYFNADYCTGQIRGLQRDEAGTWQFQNLLDTALQVTGSGQDTNGDLYIATVTDRHESGEGGNGAVWKLVAADAVSEGAVTVPLGEPGGGAIEVDEEGEPIAPAAEDALAETPSPAAAPANPETSPTATPSPAELAPIATPSSGASVAATEVSITMADIFFDPQRVAIPANTDVRLILENTGAVVHNFELRDQDISVDVEPGQSGEVIVNLPPGNYRFICNIPGHKQTGMIGVLQAQSP